MYKALVVCLENWDTLQEVPFVLTKAGCTVDVFCSKDSWLIKNKFHNQWIECPADINAYQQQLFTIARSKQYDWIVLGDEKLLKIIGDHVPDDLFTTIMPLIKIENKELLGSKEGLSDLCVRYSISTPKYNVYNHEPDFKIDTLNLTYPVLIKQDLSWGGGGISYCKTKQDLEVAIHKTNRNYTYVIQEFITGEDIGIEAFYSNGELLNYNAGKVTGYSNSKFSFTTRRKYFLNSQLEIKLKQIGTNLGINGFASIQVIYKPEENEYYFIEADLRPNFWVSSGRFTGQDFSEAIKKRINPNYQINPNKILQEGKEIEVAVFYRDFPRCLRQLNIKGVMQWVLNYKGYWKFIPTYDSVLLKNILYEIFLNKIRKKIRK